MKAEEKGETHTTLLVVLDLGVGLEAEPLGDGPVLARSLGKTSLGAEGLLGRLLEGQAQGREGKAKSDGRRAMVENSYNGLSLSCLALCASLPLFPDEAS